MKRPPNRPWKILVFNWQDMKHPLAGGAEVHLHEIFRRIAAKGHLVTLYCSTFPGVVEQETLEGIKVIREGSRNLFNFYVPRRYRSQFRYEGYDIVIDDVNKIPFYTPWFVREPVLAFVHHFFRKSIFLEAAFPGAVYVYLAEWIALTAYKKTPIAVYSESSREELVSHGFSASRIYHVPIAITAHKYHRVSSKKSPAPIVGYLGRIKKYKSIDHLLRAFQIVRNVIPEAQLIILGDGDARPDLERLAQELNISSAVRFTGFIDEKEKVRLLQQTQVVVNTSAKEGWGLTVTEANAYGVPVVASDVPGLRDSVIEGKTGLLYEYGNIPQLAEKILELLRNKKFREKLGAEGMKWARSLTWDSSAEKMLQVIERVIADRRMQP